MNSAIAPNHSQTSRRPLGLDAAARLDSAAIDVLRRLESRDLSFVTKRLRNVTSWSDAEVEAAVTELRRFFAVAYVQRGNVAVESDVVDEAWHQFLLFTKKYREFCAEVFGYFMDHQPVEEPKADPAGMRTRFREGYVRLFGQLPERAASHRIDVSDCQSSGTSSVSAAPPGG